MTRNARHRGDAGASLRFIDLSREALYFIAVCFSCQELINSICLSGLHPTIRPSRAGRPITNNFWHCGYGRLGQKIAAMPKSRIEQYVREGISKRLRSQDRLCQAALRLKESSCNVSYVPPRYKLSRRIFVYHSALPINEFMLQRQSRRFKSNCVLLYRKNLFCYGDSRHCTSLGVSECASAPISAVSFSRLDTNARGHLLVVGIFKSQKFECWKPSL